MRAAAPRTGSAARPPWLRFLLLGALLFAGSRAWQAVGVPARADARALAGLDPAASDEEILFRVALGRGLEQTDPVVRRRLVQNLRFAAPDDPRSDDELVAAALRLGMHESDLVVRRRLAQRIALEVEGAARGEEPGEAELDAYRLAHPERFQLPARWRIEQRAFASAAAAERARAALEAGGEPRDALPLPLPRALGPASRREIEAAFGPGFAAAVAGLPPRAWSAPIRSAYAFHAVRVVERSEAEAAPLAAVRGQVREALLAERAARALHRALAEWRREAGGGGAAGSGA